MLLLLLLLLAVDNDDDDDNGETTTICVSRNSRKQNAQLPYLNGPCPCLLLFTTSTIGCISSSSVCLSMVGVTCNSDSKSKTQNVRTTEYYSVCMCVCVWYGMVVLYCVAAPRPHKQKYLPRLTTVSVCFLPLLFGSSYLSAGVAADLLRMFL